MLNHLPHTSWRLSRAALLGALVLGLVTAVAGCDLSGSQPVTAQSILQAASAVHYKDLTFDLTLAAAQGGQTVSGTGTGAITADPERTHYTMTVTAPSGGSTATSTYEVITDVTTATSYTRTTVNGQTSSWVAQPADLSGDASSTDFSQFVHGDNLDHPTLVGTDTVNGTNSYHLSATPRASTPTPDATTPDATTPTTSTPGTATPGTSTPGTNTPGTATPGTATPGTATPGTNAANTSTTVDIWFATNTKRLEKLVLKSATGETTSSLTLVATGYDTGLTIDLPAANPSATPSATPGSATPTGHTPRPNPSPTTVPQPVLQVKAPSTSLFPCVDSSATVTVTNGGAKGSTLKWSASTSDPTYSISPTSGSLGGGQSTSVTVSNIVTTDTVTFTAPGATGSPQTVTFTCTP